LGSKVLFQPEWGFFDLSIGTKVVSVFGGPADRASYGGFEDFPAKKVNLPTWTAEQKNLQKIYSDIRSLREKDSKASELLPALENLFTQLEKSFPKDWLSRLEIYEILCQKKISGELNEKIKKNLLALKQSDSKSSSLIEDGLRLT
jgi:phenylalanine-4-hydroxylase